MSKINPIQAAALNSTTVKTEVSKVEASKPAVAKTTPAKPVAPKTIAVKPVAVKPVVAAKVAPKTTLKKIVKAKVVKIEKEKEKTPKLKMERDSFTMPKAEYAQFYVLKERLAKLGQPVKKSELLRAGIMQLTAMTDAALKSTMSKVPAIKTGRPKKK